MDPDGGPCVFDVAGVPVGLVICEDLWLRAAGRHGARAGAELVVVPNASPYERGKHAQRDALLAERTRDTGVAIAYLNVVGGQDALVFDGASVVADGDARTRRRWPLPSSGWWSSTRRMSVVSCRGCGVDDGDESVDALAWRA